MRARTYATEQDTTAGKVFTVTGQDWDSVVAGIDLEAEERVVVNMGPQHPSTHGVLRLILELDGETVTECRCGIGYLHTGIEKNMEYRNWTQGVTFCTRMDYLVAVLQRSWRTASASSGCSTSSTTSPRRRRSCASSSWSSTGSRRTSWRSPPAAWRSAR